MNGMTVFVAEHGGLYLGEINILRISGVPRNFVRVGGPTNSDADRGQRMGIWGP
jgi:hypothetical protein